MLSASVTNTTETYTHIYKGNVFVPDQSLNYLTSNCYRGAFTDVLHYVSSFNLFFQQSGTL